MHLQVKGQGPVHTELLAITLVLAMQKMGRIHIVNDPSLSLRDQCEEALNEEIF